MAAGVPTAAAPRGAAAACWAAPARLAASGRQAGEAAKGPAWHGARPRARCRTALGCGGAALAARAGLAGAARGRPGRAARRCGGAAARRPAPLADGFRCLLLDCDGVLWLGGAPIEGSAEAVAALRAAGRHMVFVTNASARSREEVAQRISASLGLAVGPGDVVTSGSVVAAEAVVRGVEVAYALGAEGLLEELRLAGVRVVRPALPEPFDEDALCAACDAVGPVGAVIVGHDERFSYAKLAAASHFLQRGGDRCHLLGTNPDVGNRARSGLLVPEAGALLAAVEAASGRTATVTGKPAPALVRQVLERYALEPHEVLMVGDRLDTDIRFGASAGLSTCLVLTGVSTREEAAALPAEQRPGHVRASLRDVVCG